MAQHIAKDPTATSSTRALCGRIMVPGMMSGDPCKSCMRIADKADRMIKAADEIVAEFEAVVAADAPAAPNPHYACDTHGAVCPTGEHNGHRSDLCPKCLQEISEELSADDTVTIGELASELGTDVPGLATFAGMLGTVRDDRVLSARDAAEIRHVWINTDEHGSYVPTYYVAQARRGPGGDWLTFPDAGPWSDSNDAIVWTEGAVALVPDSQWRVVTWDGRAATWNADVTGVVVWTGPVPQTAAKAPEVPADAPNTVSVPGGPLAVGASRSGSYRGAHRTVTDVDGPVRFRSAHGKRKIHVARRYRRG